jgi:hypothetical protein
MSEASAQPGCEICVSDGGTRLTLHPPILGTVCSRCAERIDDVCFLIEGGDVTDAAGGLCGRCLIALLRSVTTVG